MDIVGRLFEWYNNGTNLRAIYQLEINFRTPWDTPLFQKVAEDMSGHYNIGCAK